MPRRKTPYNFFDVKRKKDGNSPFVLDLRKKSKGAEPQESKVGLKSILRAREFGNLYGDSMSEARDTAKTKSLTQKEPSIFFGEGPRKEDLLEELKKFEVYESGLISPSEQSRGDELSDPNKGNAEPFKLKLIPVINSSFACSETESYGNSEARKEWDVVGDYEPEFDISEMVNYGNSKPDSRLEGAGEDTISKFFSTAAAHKSPNRYGRHNKNTLQKENERNANSAISVFRRVGSFSLASIVLAGMIFGALFVYKGLDAKDRSATSSQEAYENFKQAKESLKNLDFGKAAESFSSAYDNIVKAEESLKGVGRVAISVAENLPFDSRADSAISLLSAAKHIALAGETLSSAFLVIPLDEMFSAESLIGLLREEGARAPGLSPEMFESFGELLDKAEFEVAAAKSELEKVKPSDFPVEFQESVRDLKEQVPALLNLITLARDYSRISSNLFGNDSPKRYFVAFQNSSEIRPTGGFIGSFAVLEFSEGKLTDMLVDGIYSADGRLTVNVVPPKPFQHITTAWSTHDANWFFDFPSSAEKLAWFYEKTGGGEIDGVISLNIEVVEDLLELTGSIAIEEYGLILDSENFRDEIQYEVEVAYDKELNRPKKVLADFTPIFLERLSEIVKTSGSELLAKSMEGLDAKNIMFYFKDENVQEFFDKHGWTGRANNQQSAISHQQSDYFAVVHSNIGGYKTDKFVEDKIDYKAEIQSDGSVIGNLKIERIHSGGKSEYWWYNRNSIDYVKIYAPEGSELISYSGGQRRDETGAPDYVQLGFDEDLDISEIESYLTKSGTVDIFSEGQRTVFATWLVTRPGRTSLFEIRYKLPFKVKFENGAGKYDLRIQKQGGREPSVNLSVAVPGGWEVPWNSTGGGNETISFILNKDKTVGYILKN